MKLLLQSAMIFFGTLMAAGLVALGEPAKADIALTASAFSRPGNSVARADRHPHPLWIAVAARHEGGLR